MYAKNNQPFSDHNDAFVLAWKGFVVFKRFHQLKEWSETETVIVNSVFFKGSDQSSAVAVGAAGK